MISRNYAFIPRKMARKRLASSHFFPTHVRPVPEYYVYFVFVVNAAAAGSSKTPPPPRATQNVPLMMIKLPES